MRPVLLAFILSVLFPARFLYAEDGAVKASTVPAAGVGAVDYSGMALIPRGEFLMGSDEKTSPNEQPRHRVFLNSYFIDKHEVTAARYRRFTEATGRQMPRQSFPDSENYPAVYMNWHDAMAYCEYYGKSLPTEAQWEKAARGGADGKFCSGDEGAGLGGYAWFWDNSGKKIHPVGLKKSNAYGLYDMHGNVLEWTADWYAADYYSAGPAENPQGPAQGDAKVIRGGSAFVSADLCRSAARMHSSPETRYSVKGFRCAAPVPQARAEEIILSQLAYRNGIVEGQLFNNSQRTAQIIIVEISFLDPTGKILLSQEFKAVPGGDGRALLPRQAKHFNYNAELKTRSQKVQVTGKIRSVDFE